MHKHHLLLSLIAVMTILASNEVKASSIEQNEANVAPKLVVNILVDQLRSDYLEAFEPLYGTDGLRRMMEQGTVYTHGQYSFSPVDAASAAATVASGTSPKHHGIVAQQWLQRETLRPFPATYDAQAKGINTTATHSARWLNVSTLTDELKVATAGKARIVSIAPNAETAIFSAGHAADNVVWMDEHTGNWASSIYYGTFPKWAEQRNVYQNIEVRLQTKVWQPLHPQICHTAYLLSTATKDFSHQFKGSDAIASFKTSALVNEEVAATALAALENSDLGSDATTDVLSVTLYAGTHLQKSAANSTFELQDTYARLDRAVAEIINAAEKKTGQGQALFTLTSTGYCLEEEGNRSKYRIPTGNFDMRRNTNLLGMYLVALYGQGNYIDATFGTQIFLNHRLIEERKLNFSELQQRIEDFLLQLSGVKNVYTTQRLLKGAWTPELATQRNGHFTQRSGDITIQLQPDWKLTNADHYASTKSEMALTHFPIVFYGAGVKRQVITTPVTVEHMAPTLSKAIRIRAPNACEDSALI